MDGPQVEVLTDVTEATDVLTDAFLTDRATRDLVAGDRRSLRRLYELMVPMMLRNPDSILLGIRDERGLASVAVCQGPGKDISLLKMTFLGFPLWWRMGRRRVGILWRFGVALHRHSPLRPNHLRLAILGTRPDAFGRGYGAALLKRIEQHAVSRNLHSTYLEADADGYPRRLYERHGYRVEKQFDTEIGSVIVMVKPLHSE
jgi:ribosomal protein S18 acetylase RimI-like enzyme